ncbi:hypothetical protein D3C81_821710 [compost metagenome]
MLGKLDGVADQIGQHLLEAQRIEQCVAAGRRLDDHLQGQAFLPRLAIEDTAHRLDQCRQVDRLRRE